MVRYFPAIIRFLGYVSFGHDETLGGRLEYLRKCVGFTQVELADLVQIDPAQLGRYEQNLLGRDSIYRMVLAALNDACRQARLLPFIRSHS